MESPPTHQKTLTPSSDLSLEDAPLLNLLGKSFSQMSPEELRVHVTTLREVSSSPMTLKKSLSVAKAEAKTNKATEPKQSGKDLTSKYLNFGKPKA